MPATQIIRRHAEQIAGTNSYIGLLTIDGETYECKHSHASYRSAKQCADLDRIAQAQA